MHAPTTTPRLRKRTAWDIQRAVFLALFVRELKTRFGGRWLGVFWVLLEPTAHLAMLLVIFAFIRHRLLPGLEFPVFLLTGLVPFFVFRNLTLRGMDSVDSNRGLFGYRQVKRNMACCTLANTLVRVIYQIFVKVCQKRKCDPLWVKDRLVYGAKCR